LQGIIVPGAEQVSLEIDTSIKRNFDTSKIVQEVEEELKEEKKSSEDTHIAFYLHQIVEHDGKNLDQKIEYVQFNVEGTILNS